MKARCKVGDRVREHGIPGRWCVVETKATDSHVEYLLARSPGERGIIWARDSWIVEINNAAVPLLAAPISSPAIDYPYRHTFIDTANMTQHERSLAESSALSRPRCYRIATFCDQVPSTSSRTNRLIRTARDWLREWDYASRADVHWMHGDDIIAMIESAHEGGWECFVRCELIADARHWLEENDKLGHLVERFTDDEVRTSIKEVYPGGWDAFVGDAKALPGAQA